MSGHLGCDLVSWLCLRLKHKPQRKEVRSLKDLKVKATDMYICSSQRKQPVGHLGVCNSEAKTTDSSKEVGNCIHSCLQSHLEV